MQRILEYIVVFAVLVLLQEFAFDKINFWGVVNPYIYIMFIIMLPMELRGWLVLFLGFFTGTVIDLLSGSAGLHMIAATWMAFVRPTVLNFTAGRDAVQEGGIPTSSLIGAGKFLAYAGVMTLLFAIPFFLLEVMSIENIYMTLLRILLSSAATVIIVYFFQLPFDRGARKKRS